MIRNRLLPGCCLLVVLAAGPVLAAEDGLDEVLSGFESDSAGQAVETPAGSGLDEVLGGFEGEAEQEPAKTADRVLPGWLDLGGSLSVAGSVNFAHEAPAENEPDYRGLSMLRTTGALECDVRLADWQLRISGHLFYDGVYSLQGRGQYSDELLDLYEQELELDETYLSGSLLPSLDLKTGRQIVVWGKSDNVRVTDILNPLDNRLPGMVDIKNRRLPVTMTRLDYYLGDWNLSGIMVHEVRFARNPVFNSDFFPGSSPLPPEQTPGWSLDNQQYGLALNGIFSGWDLSLYWARVYDDRSHLVMDEQGTPVRVHGRIGMLGLSGNVALGNWLLKGEGAWFDGLEYTSLPQQEVSRLDLMAGIEYMGFSETVLSLELVNRHILEYDAHLALSPDYLAEDSMQAVAKLVRDFANDTIQLKILLSVFGWHGEDGAFERFQLDYDLNDQLTLTGGIIFYQAADQGALATIGDNDRLFFEISYEW